MNFSEVTKNQSETQKFDSNFDPNKRIEKNNIGLNKIFNPNERIHSETKKHDKSNEIQYDPNKRIESENFDKLLDDYLNDVISKSEYPETIDKEQIKKEKFEKCSPEETAEKREEFRKKKNDLIAEWEKINGKEWPRYKHDVYDDKGNLIRKAGMRYDAHHIQPLEMGGKNTAKNLTPISAEKHYDHKGVHAPDSPFNKLEKFLEENKNDRK